MEKSLSSPWRRPYGSEQGKRTRTLSETSDPPKSIIKKFLEAREVLAQEHLAKTSGLQMTRTYTGLMDQTPSRYFLRTPAKKVSVNNQASDFFTVIEVSSAEQPGLLYHLAKKLFSLELDIRFARVHTDKERMTGVFYVSDPGGQKVQAEKQIEGIKEGILTLMDQYLPGIILWGLWVSVCQSLESDSI